MADIIHLHKGEGEPELNAAKMLRAIAKQKPRYVFCIVWWKKGMPSYHSSTSDMPTLLMRCQEFIHKYFNGDFHG